MPSDIFDMANTYCKLCCCIIYLKTVIPQIVYKHVYWAAVIITVCMYIFLVVFTMQYVGQTEGNVLMSLCMLLISGWKLKRCYSVFVVTVSTWLTLAAIFLDKLPVNIPHLLTKQSIIQFKENNVFPYAINPHWGSIYQVNRKGAKMAKEMKDQYHHLVVYRGIVTTLTFLKPRVVSLKSGL